MSEKHPGTPGTSDETATGDSPTPGTEQAGTDHMVAEHPDTESESGTEQADTTSAAQSPETTQQLEFENMIANVEDLEAQIVSLQRAVAENREGWQRSRAEFANYKKRVAKELTESREKAALDTLTKILPVFDDFERALDNVPEDLADHPWVSGTSLIMRKFERILEEYDVTTIDPVGEPFDPHRHEAIGVDTDSEYDPEVVTATLQKGYISGDRVLRPAMVRVAG